MTSLHCIQFSIYKPLTNESLVLPQSCNILKAPFKFLNYIVVNMPSEDGFKTLFDDLSLNFYLYIGHTVRFMNQNNVIKSVMEKINDGSSVCVVVMNFKMNFETMKHRENTVENFGKRGISWHVNLVFYSVQVYFGPDLY